MGTYTVSANAGDHLLARMEETSGNYYPDILVYHPDGTVLCNSWSGSKTNIEIQSCAADQTGTYAILVGNLQTTQVSGTGTYSFYVQRTNNPGNPIAASYGNAIDGSLTSAAQMDTYTVVANAGDHLLVRMEETSGNYYPDILVYRPDGTVLCNSWSGSKTNIEIQSCAADQSGTYAILVGNLEGTQVSGTGTYSFYVQRTNNPAGAAGISLSGSASNSIGSAALMNSYRVVASSGDAVSIDVSQTGGTLEPEFILYRPDGSVLCWGYTAWPAKTIEQSCTFDTTGVHTLLVGNITGLEGGPGAGSYTLTLQGARQSNKILGNAAFGAGLPPGTMYGTATTDTTPDPIDVVSGNFTQVHTDLSIAGPGLPLALTRSYSAQDTQDNASPLGSHWADNWQMSLTSLGGNGVLINLPGGVSQDWVNVNGTWMPPPGIAGTLVQNGDGTWTYTTANQYTYNFDSNGRWTSASDRNGNTTTLTYNGSGQLTTIADSVGRSLTLAYNTNGNISSVSDGLGRSVGYAYDANDDLTTITDVNGGTASYQYTNHLLTQGTDADGNVFVRNTYDGSNRVTQQVDALNGTTTLAYSTPAAGATKVTDQRGKATTYYFDSQLRITDVVDPDGNATTSTWDANNNRTSLTNPLNRTWHYTYDGDQNLLTKTDPKNNTWTYTYDPFNDVLTATDPLNHTTSYGYDTHGNLTSVTNALNQTTTYTVNSQGLVTAVMDPLGHTTTYGYDAHGNRTSVTDPLNHTSSSVYDLGGRMTSSTDALGKTTTYTYDNANDLLTTTDPLGHITTNTYDANGNLLTTKDADGNVTTYGYNAKGERTTVTDAAGGVTTTGYDAVGNIVSKEDPLGHTTTYTYDNENRLLTETDALNDVTTYTYNGAGERTSRKDGKGQTTTYAYDAAGQLTTTTYPDSTTTTYAYDAAGNKTSLVDSTGTTTYTYDALDRLSSVAYPGSRTVSYTYDAAGNVSSITYPGGSNAVTYGYDNANELTTVTDWNAKVTGYSYDDNGQMTTENLPNGITGTASYDDAGRLTGISYSNGTSTVASAGYTLDSAGNRLTRTDGSGTETYTYDNLNRLVTASGPVSATYSYDAFGNRTGLTNATGATTYAYNAGSEITSVTPPSPGSAVTYTYDADGNLTARGSDTFAYDYDNELTAAAVGGTTTTYTYSGGLRQTATSNGTTTTYTWDINSSVPEMISDGTYDYVYGLGDTPIEQVSSTGTTYYLPDGLGSVMATTDASGNVVNTYSYDVYGATTSSPGSQPNPFQFAGQQTDSTGFQYLRARYYDPATGTFISSDPMGVSPAWPGNPFLYANGNPALLVDPYGLFGLPSWNDVKNGAKVVGSSLVDAGKAAAGVGGDCLSSSRCGTLLASAALVTGLFTDQPWLVWGATGYLFGNDMQGCVNGSGRACVSAGITGVGIGFLLAGGEYSVLSNDPIGSMLQSSTRLFLNEIGSRAFLTGSAVYSSWIALREKQS